MTTEQIKKDLTNKTLTLNQVQKIIERATGFLSNGGDVTIQPSTSIWTGGTRWARNEIISSIDTRINRITIVVDKNGAKAQVSISNHSDNEIRRAVEICERVIKRKSERYNPLYELPSLLPLEVPVPKTWHSSTNQLSDSLRADLFFHLSKESEEQGLLSAGYIEAESATFFHANQNGTLGQRASTSSQLSITVRSPDGNASGWAGSSWDDWDKIDHYKVARTALEKCIQSANPVAIEPGRYEVVLEPQAVSDLIGTLFSADTLSRYSAENFRTTYTLKHGYSKLGLQLFDANLRVSLDPYHPEMSHDPYEAEVASPALPVTWVENGILTNLAHDRMYAIRNLGTDKSQTSTSSYLLEGTGPKANIDIDQLISDTERGLLITRFDITGLLDEITYLTSGTTRDGVWLIERGRITQSVRNMRFTESPIFMLNNVIAYGKPQRVFSPRIQIMVPAIRARDFSFTSTIHAI